MIFFIALSIPAHIVSPHSNAAFKSLSASLPDSKSLLIPSFPSPLFGMPPTPSSSKHSKLPKQTFSVFRGRLRKKYAQKKPAAKILPPSIVAQRNKTIRANRERLEASAERLTETIKELIAAEAAEHNLSEEKLILELGVRGWKQAKIQSRANPVNGFMKLMAEKMNDGKSSKISLLSSYLRSTTESWEKYLRLKEEYDLLTEEEKFDAVPPVEPKLVSSADIAKDQEAMSEYRQATAEQKEVWREVAEAARSPSNNKKVTTLANRDIAATNRRLSMTVSSSHRNSDVNTYISLG